MTDTNSNPHAHQKSRLESLMQMYDRYKAAGLIDEITVQPWTLNDAMKMRIVALAGMGLNLASIAKALGITADTFRKKRDENAEIDRLIDFGRTQAITELHEMTWDAAKNLRDNARNQELSRLHRMLKTEEVDTVTGADEQAAQGFTVTIVPAKSANTSSGAA